MKTKTTQQIHTLFEMNNDGEEDIKDKLWVPVEETLDLLEKIIDDLRTSNDMWRHPVDGVADMIFDRFKKEALEGL